MQLLKKFFRDDSGVTAIEYGLIAALIVVGIIAAGLSLYGTFAKKPPAKGTDPFLTRTAWPDILGPGGFLFTKNLFQVVFSLEFSVHTDNRRYIMTILLLQMGGTIDKDYQGSNENHGYNFSIAEPAFLDILARLKSMGVGVPWRYESICKKDSLEHTDEDRRKLRDRAYRAEEYRVLVTHGTDTIKKTAEVLRLIKKKTIVLTGAIQPAKFKNSDAEFNFGMAFAAVQLLPPGVYIALQGTVVEWQFYKF